MAIHYSEEASLSVDEFTGILFRSTLAARRPVDDPERVQQMLDGSTAIITARADGELVGVARAISDKAFCTYLSDLAVDHAWQGQGIGRQLVDETHRICGINTSLIILAAPAAESYYPHIGMTAHNSCWIRKGKASDEG